MHRNTAFEAQLKLAPGTSEGNSLSSWLKPLQNPLSRVSLLSVLRLKRGSLNITPTAGCSSGFRQIGPRVTEELDQSALIPLIIYC
jgi:hypothetical protein